MRRLLLALLALVGCDEPAGPPLPDPAEHRRLLPNEACAQCHPRQVAEYAASAMNHAAFSPVFNAQEQALAEVFGAPFAGHQAEPAANFCADCHAPIAARQGVLATGEGPLRDQLDHPTAQGITCDVCHRALGPDHAASPAGDGVGNAALVIEPGVIKLGPLADPTPNAFHAVTGGGGAYLQSAAFCGACHDVRLPGTPDAVTGEAMGRLENLFTEWARSPWADATHPWNPLRGQPGIAGLHDDRQGDGEQVTCQDCHMSRYPARGLAEPVPLAAFEGVDPASLSRKAHKLYAAGRAADAEGPTPVRRVASHRFAAVSNPLVPWPLAPDLADPLGVPPDLDPTDWSETGTEAACATAVDAWGDPACVLQRRTALLQAAITLADDEIPAQATPGAPLDLRLWVENVGAGHNVPAGMSQSRQVWVEVALVDEGRPCDVHAECADLVEARRFVEDPVIACTPRGPDGAPDALFTAQSWDLAARAERSGHCDAVLRRCVIYRSGYLVDRDGDGRVDDEDLRHQIVELDAETLDERCVAPGADADQRVLGIQQGLVWFHNGFQRVAVDDDGQPLAEPQADRWLRPTAAPVQPQRGDPPVLDQDPRARRSAFATERALYERVRYRPAPHAHGRFGLSVASPLRANRFFDGQALRPFEPRLARYVITVPEGVVGPLRLDARVRLRFFDPLALRALAARSALVDEAMIDRALRVVDLAQTHQSIGVAPAP